MKLTTLHQGHHFLSARINWSFEFLLCIASYEWLLRLSDRQNSLLKTLENIMWTLICNSWQLAGACGLLMIIASPVQISTHKMHDHKGLLSKLFFIVLVRLSPGGRRRNCWSDRLSQRNHGTPNAHSQEPHRQIRGQCIGRRKWTSGSHTSADYYIRVSAYYIRVNEYHVRVRDYYICMGTCYLYFLHILLNLLIILAVNNQWLWNCKDSINNLKYIKVLKRFAVLLFGTIVSLRVKNIKH